MRYAVGAMLALLAALAGLFLRSAGPVPHVRPEGPEPEDEDDEADKSASAGKRLLKVVGIILVGLLLGLAALMLMESSLIFYPDAEPLGGTWEPPELGVTYLRFTTRDGVELHAWWKPASEVDTPEDQPVLLWCHGNAGNISRPTDRRELLKVLTNAGLNVFLFDYRGYGASGGSPNEEGLYLDGQAAYDYLVEERGIDPCRIFVYGRSLGAPVALHIALHREVQGVILDGAFASIPRMAAIHPLLRPFTFLIRNRFDSIEKARRLEVPLLMIHGAQDEIVPMSQAREIRDAARNSPQRNLWPVTQAKHSDTFFVALERYKARLRDFCETNMDCVE